MSSFMILDLAIATNSEQFNLKDRVVPLLQPTLTYLNTSPVSGREVPGFPSQRYRAEAEGG